MTISSQLSRLFDEWRRERSIPRFVPDGIVCDSVWERAEKKIFWILKDSNTNLEVPVGLMDPPRHFAEALEWPQGFQDWPEPLRPASSRFWQVVLRRSYGIENDPCSCEEAEARFRQSGVWRRIGGLNLKKEAGEDTVAPEVIQEWARKDREFIMRELEIVKPSVILCGGTFDVFCNVVLQVPHESDGWAWWGNTIVVAGGVPSYETREGYDYAMAQYQEGLQSRGS